MTVLQLVVLISVFLLVAAPKMFIALLAIAVVGYGFFLLSLQIFYAIQYFMLKHKQLQR